MKRALFFRYCSVLFDVLDKFDAEKAKLVDFHSERTNGYLGEVFTGIYILNSIENGCSVLQVPRIDVNSSLLKRIKYVLFPPETKRRFLAKKIVKKIISIGNRKPPAFTNDQKVHDVSVK